MCHILIACIASRAPAITATGFTVPAAIVHGVPASAATSRGIASLVPSGRCLTWWCCVHRGGSPAAKHVPATAHVTPTGAETYFYVFVCAGAVPRPRFPAWPPHPSGPAAPPQWRRRLAPVDASYDRVVVFCHACRTLRRGRCAVLSVGMTCSQWGSVHRPVPFSVSPSRHPVPAALASCCRVPSPVSLRVIAVPLLVTSRRHLLACYTYCGRLVRCEAGAPWPSTGDRALVRPNLTHASTSAI